MYVVACCLLCECARVMCLCASSCIWCVRALVHGAFVLACFPCLHACVRPCVRPCAHLWLCTYMRACCVLLITIPTENSELIILDACTNEPLLSFPDTTETLQTLPPYSMCMVGVGRAYLHLRGNTTSHQQHKTCSHYGKKAKFFGRFWRWVY